MSYFQAFNSEFNVIFDKISLFGMSMENLEEIEKTLGDFIKIIPLLPTHYKAGRKADYEEFVKAVKERVVPLSISLHYKTGIPYKEYTEPAFFSSGVPIKFQTTSLIDHVSVREDDLLSHCGSFDTPYLERIFMCDDCFKKNYENKLKNILEYI